ncbi:AMP-binding protein [Streptomyces sp. NPDC006372]|uniref:AMP-binding protein n=1 Tax=Streptomyces sp. NPDC006372 TaxID=3155599 RepID=UPI0033B58C39
MLHAASLIHVGGTFVLPYWIRGAASVVLPRFSEMDHLDPALTGSCGRPSVAMDLRLADEQGQPVRGGEIGEVQVKSPSQMAGYFGATELNAEVITPDGWVRTRDMAYADDRGYHFLVDRRSDMIVTGGYNVCPREVEEAIAGHPLVAECAFVGARTRSGSRP